MMPDFKQFMDLAQRRERLYVSEGPEKRARLWRATACVEVEFIRVIVCGNSFCLEQRHKRPMQ
eukprot:5930588-Amphidinium_carterae.1